MIKIECECGKELKLKDELAGKKVRCPVCMAVVPVPSSEQPADEWDQWRDLSDASAGVASPSPSLPKRRPKGKQKKSGGGLKWGMKAVFGVLAIIIGVAIGIGICIAVFTGNGNARMLKGLFMPVVFIGFGISWIKGETYGS